MRRGSAVEVDPVPVVHLGIDSQGDDPEANQDIDDEAPEDVIEETSHATDESPEADQNADDAPRKPLKTDKIAVFQAWARHLGDNPDGKKLDELKALYL